MLADVGCGDQDSERSVLYALETLVCRDIDQLDRPEPHLDRRSANLTPQRYGSEEDGDSQGDPLRQQ